MFDNIDEDEINEELFSLLNIPELQKGIGNLNKELVATAKRLIAFCAENSLEAAKECRDHYDKLYDIREVLLTLRDIKLESDSAEN